MATLWKPLWRLVLICSLVILDTQLPARVSATVVSCSGTGTTFASGGGTTADPYIVTNASMLAGITGSYLSCSFRLGADITVTGAWTPLAPDTDPSTTAFQGTAFTGEFDGAGFAVRGISVTETNEDFRGLFGYLRNATVTDLTLGGSVTGRNYVGALAGNIESSVISGVTSSVSVSGQVYVGGLVGESWSASTITDSYVAANTQGLAPAVSQVHSLGGLVGSVDETTIRDVTVVGNITLVRGQAGGIAGYLEDSTITTATYRGDMTGSDLGSAPEIVNSVGGVAGELSGSSVTNATVISNIVAFEYVGGIMGYAAANSAVTAASFTGSIAGETWVGGVGGYVEDSRVSGARINADLNAQDKKSERSFNTVGGIVGDMTTGTIADSRYSGSITAALHQVGGIAGYLFDVNVTSSRSSGTITASSQENGGLAGYAEDSTISQSYSDMAVTGTKWSGGLFGYLDNTSLADTYARGAVTGTQYVAGLVGQLTAGSTITRSYSTGSVTGSSDVGGLIGASATSTTSASFWDSITSGLSTSAGGTAKTTTQLRTLTTFTDAGWSIVDGSDCSSTWGLISDRNDSYPYLQVFYPRSCGETSQVPPSWYQSVARISADSSCPQGWNPSWAEWPNERTGGFVCNREIYWDVRFNGWSSRSIALP